MRNKILLLSAASALGVGIAGCGGSSNSGLSYSAFSDAAEKICANGNTQSKALPPVNSLESAVSVLPKQEALLQDGINKLNALKGPAALESARDTFVADLNSELSSTKSAQAAAQAKNRDEFLAAAESAGKVNSKAHTDGSKLGAKDCAS